MYDSGTLTPAMPAPSAPAGVPPSSLRRLRSVRHVRPTRLQEACVRLEEMAERLGPGARMPTAQQLRGEVGVSAATLNRALADLEGRGIIRRKHGVGIFVAGTQSPVP